MSSSRLILAVTCMLALSAPAFAQQPPPGNTGQVLTQEYARLYREFLDKKKLGLDADAASKYAEFLAAFRKHRLISRLGVSDGGTAENGGASTGGDTGGGGDGSNDLGGYPGEAQRERAGGPQRDVSGTAQADVIQRGSGDTGGVSARRTSSPAGTGGVPPPNAPAGTLPPLDNGGVIDDTP